MDVPHNKLEPIECKCGWCGDLFFMPPHVVRRGRGRFCSRSCSSAHGRSIRSAMAHDGISLRYEKYVVRRGPDECWGWTGFKYKGYGRLNVGGMTKGAHRVSYEINVGAVPDGLTVLHRCDNPECTNPHHLFLGTNADNNLDRDQKGRAARGERIHRAKLDAAKVRQIRTMDPKSPTAQRALGERLGVSEGTIRAVLTGRTWGHVE
jgi:hypothetical protein